MSLRINDTAPDFTAETTHGTIHFHDWLGDSWGVLFSHPKDFTPVCTTELGALAKLQPDFEKRNVKVVGLSVDPISDHNTWLDDIADVSGMRPEYPIIADTELAVAKPIICCQLMKVTVLVDAPLMIIRLFVPFLSLDLIKKLNFLLHIRWLQDAILLNYCGLSIRFK